MIGKRTIALFSWLFVMLLTVSASATLSPAQAESDSAAATAAHRGFCDQPDAHLNASDLELCPMSSDLPNCAGFQAACDRQLHETHKADLEWLNKLLALLARAIGKLFKLLGPIGLWLVAVLVLLLILFPIVQALVQSRRDAQLADPVPFPVFPMKTETELAKLSRDDDPNRVLEEANRLASQGDLDRALYRYLHAALLALDKEGAIRIARETTHGEYVRACTDTEARSPLRELVREIEVVRFGGREPSLGAVQVAQERATRIVRRALTALVALSALLFVGCHLPSSGGRASGHDSLRALLEKQNVKVESTSASLAKIPFPTDKNRRETPALFVDVMEAPLQPEAQAHLIEWVEAGGQLVLAGPPDLWPAALHASTPKPAPTSTEITVTTLPDDEDSDEEPRVDHGRLARPAAVTWVDDKNFVIASTSDERDYAVGQLRGHGAIYAVASNDLFTNAGLLVPGNAGAAVAIFAVVPRTRFTFAAEGSGFSPPSNPFAGLISAGLAMPLVHALVATIILFFAVGIRLSAPRPETLPQRRAFTEHIYATAAVYGRGKAAKHALASFGRYAENRVAKKLNRGATDVVTFLAQRSGERIEECAHLWGRALAAREAEMDPPNGDELKILQRLSAIYSRAMQ